jgi:hypothetical protein
MDVYCIPHMPQQSAPSDRRCGLSNFHLFALFGALKLRAGF